MKTSARNQLRGTVKAIRQGSISAEVVLDIGDGLEIFANITNEAVEDLRLVPGREAVALIKASFIMLSTDENIRTSARNRLVGVVSAVIRGGVNSEVKIQLVGGRTLTAIVTCKALQGTRSCRRQQLLRSDQGVPCPDRGQWLRRPVSLSVDRSASADAALRCTHQIRATRYARRTVPARLLRSRRPAFLRDAKQSLTIEALIFAASQK